MPELYAALLEIRTALWVQLAAILGVLAATCMLATQQQEAAPLFDCGTWEPAGRSVPSAQQWTDERGKNLFAVNCVSCHNKNMKDRLTGPALVDVEDRWAKFPRKDLFNFIRHSQAMIKARHPRARALWKEYKPAVMNDFSNLSDQDMEDILRFIDGH